jgi:23S rRNA pseudouridine1911/1915/1917 synthase
MRPGIVHRIDKDTSGLLVIAKNDFAHNGLSLQLQAHTVVREYIALVNGIIPNDLGRINAPIGRDPIDRMKMSVVKDGKEAITNFKVLKRYKDKTLVACRLETGRTHQIRVHFKYIGYPLVGDPLYGTRKVVGDNGQFLHAHILGFVHPRSNEYMEFKSELPDYYQEYIKELENEMK